VNASEIRSITVIGAGTMGHGIAHVAAMAGTTVQLYDAVAGAAAAGIEKIAKNLAKGVELGKVSAADRDAALGRIRAFDELAAACTGADCVIEAVPERIELKREIFRAVDQAAPAHALLATNTSSLADRGDRGERPRTGPARRHALLQPRARDEARRGRPVTRARIRRASPQRSRSQSGSARRDHRERCAGLRVEPGSSR